MRTALAAAAAGALILGSAGGVVADPGKAQGPKDSASEPTTKLQTVRIKGHKKIDLANETALQTQLKLRAKVRYSKKVKADESQVELKLAVYTAKVNGAMAGEAWSADPLALTKPKYRKNQFYAGTAGIADAQADLTKVLANQDKAYICISSLGEGQSFGKFSQQTRMRLGKKAEGDDYTKKIVRDCVKVVNSATDSTPEAQPTS
jgi:hypothetical protein